jgi:hypothetical protein
MAIDEERHTMFFFFSFKCEMKGTEQRYGAEKRGKEKKKKQQILNHKEGDEKKEKKN